MKIKSWIQSAIRTTMLVRMRSVQKKHIEKLTQSLKNRNIYKNYPTDYNNPVITNYKFFKKADLKWLDFYYSVNSNPDPNYISVPIYNYCETILNDRMLTYALKEKNFYNKFMRYIPTPVTILRRINGIYYDESYCRIESIEIIKLLTSHNKVIIKPTVESGGGSSILVFEKEGSELISGNSSLGMEFFNSYKKDFVIQEFVEQHKFYSQLNPSSNNTVRIFTYRSIKDDTVNILHCLLRIGASGSYLDHDHLGGMVLAINDNNRVSDNAIDLFGKKYSSVNNINFSELRDAPAMEEIRSLAEKISNDIYYGRIMALDFTVNKNGKPLLLEINCWRNGINQYQMHNGGLFKGFTSEILDYCQKQTPRFVLNI